LTDSQPDIGKLEQQRRQGLEQIRALGVDPYGGRYDGAELADSIRRRFKDGDDSQRARCAGRIVLLRDIGKLIFITLRDWTGTIQAGLSRQALGDQWDLAKLLQLGDLIGVEGSLGRTKTGELTIWVSGGGLTLLSKCLTQPPEKFHGLVDVDQRYRQRYVDLWINPEVMERFKKRSGIVATLRSALESRGFLEVETPMMQPIAGGAAAKPFVTHHNSLDIDLYLRISPELFLKRLLVGGMERVFEINRNFRNEGLSTRHNPEFTMIEVYQAYGDYRAMMELTEDLVCLCAERFAGGLTLPFGDLTLDLTRPWRRATYAELVKEHAGCDIRDKAAVRAKARELGIAEAGMDDDVVINEVFEATVEGRLVNPTFVMDYPAALCPLTRRKKDDPGIAERFELYIAGMELANAYTELNDPAVQEENFRIQLRGQQESMATMDTDFVAALKYGMPPAGGLGIGIDRLVMILTGATTIRDVILFPHLRPKDL
jgi:lysyl-tRNA synthetase class 2